VTDPRVSEYAGLLVDRCLGVQARWQVAISAHVLARPLIEEVQRQIARRGAWAITQLSWDGNGGAWMREAADDLLREPAPLNELIQQNADAFMSISAPENVRDAADLPAERVALAQAANATVRGRTLAMSVPWVVCQFPTDALAQEAGLTLRQFEEFLYGACLLDWDREGERMRRIADRIDEATEVRLVADGTDLVLAVEGRRCEVDDGHINMPGGEVFVSPVEDATEGLVTFSEYPATYFGHEVEGAWLRFEGGRVVDAGAARGEDYLLGILDTDPGARVLGELGIGCNPGITRHMKNVLFDEKISGTVHLALGRSYASTGGVNQSLIHWDMVKDLRKGGRLYLDGELVQENGSWLERP
jgi:aminopeptidase